ncbi:MAG: FKBP-type peptidyl-prolyl cis-trans isomerase [Pseudohongiellaceae bacterium]
MQFSTNPFMRTVAAAGVFGLAATFASTSALAQDIDLENEADRIGYSIGVNIAQNLTDQGLTSGINVTAFMQGLEDALSDDVQLSQDQMMQALTAFQEQLTAAQQAESESARAEAEAFLAENAERDEVMTTDSGLQYMVLEEGDGSMSPAATDTVVAHYEGRFIDGEVFDSSIARGQPAEFRLDQVIPGWTEGLQLMNTGDRYRLFIPASLGYGEGGTGPIPPFSTLIFDVELIEVNP